MLPLCLNQERSSAPSFLVDSSEEDEEPEKGSDSGVDVPPVPLEEVQSAAEEVRSAESVISSEDDPTKASFLGTGGMSSL